MTAKCRIAAIRLSQKIDRNPEYAEHIGVSIVNRRAENTGTRNVQNRENDFLLKKGKHYEYESRTVNC